MKGVLIFMSYHKLLTYLRTYIDECSGGSSQSSREAAKIRESRFEAKVSK